MRVAFNVSKTFSMLIPGLPPGLPEAKQTPKHGASSAEAVLADAIFVYKGSLIWRAAADRGTGGLGPHSFLPALVLENVPLDPSGFCYHGL